MKKKKIKKNKKKQVDKIQMEDDKCICYLNEHGHSITGFCVKHHTEWL